MSYCSNCGKCQNYGERSCSQCGQSSSALSIESAENLFGAAYSGAKVQAEMFASAIAGLGAGVNVLAVNLLGKWWDGLNEAERKHFGKALLEHLITLIGHGHFDGSIIPALAPSVGERVFDGQAAISEALVARAHELIVAKPADHRGAAAARGFRDAIEALIAEATKNAVTAVAARIIAERSELLEAHVRDKLPDIEKLAEKAVRELTDKAIADVKQRVVKG